MGLSFRSSSSRRRMNPRSAGKTSKQMSRIVSRSFERFS